MTPIKRRRQRAVPGSPVILDSGALTELVDRRSAVNAILEELRRENYRVVIPAVVLVEALSGKRGDEPINQIIKRAAEVPASDEQRCRLAAGLRARTPDASPVDALVVAEAVVAPAQLVPVILTFDPHVRAVAATADRLIVVPELQ